MTLLYIQIINFGLLQPSTVWPSDEKSKLAVNYKSINSLDVSGVPVRRRLPHFCYGSQSKSVQTQTYIMITNLITEWFTNYLKGENDAEFSR